MTLRGDVAEQAKRLAHSLLFEGQAPADHPLQRVQPERPPGDDAEVAAPAAQAPEQLGVLLAVGAHHITGRGDDLGRDQVVAGEPELGGQVADPAAESKAGDSGGADHAARGDQAVGLGGGVEVRPRGAALRDGEPSLGIDFDGAHPGQVDHQAVVDGAVAGRVVSSATHRDLQLVLLGEGERRGDIGGIHAAGDRRRPPDHE